MKSFVITLLWLSVSGCLLALLTVAITGIFGKKLPRAFACLLWLIVLGRMILPMGAPAGAVELYSPAVAGTELFQSAAPDGDTEGAQQYTADSRRDTPVIKDSAGLEPWTIAFWVWLVGAEVYALWSVSSYAVFRRRLRLSAGEPTVGERAAFDEMYTGRAKLIRSPLASTPMLVGIFRPTIVLPDGEYSDQAELENILRHELAHLKRGDVLYKWLAAAVGWVHWFNPLMPLIRREISRECELACDEAVIRNMSDDCRTAYGNTLIHMSADRPAAAGATAMCEEKRQLKKRLESIKAYKKGGGSAILAAVLALALVGCAAVSGPSKGNTGAIYDGTAYSTVNEITANMPGPRLVGTDTSGIAFDGQNGVSFHYSDGTQVPLTAQLYNPEKDGDYSRVGFFVSLEKTVIAYGTSYGAPITVHVSSDEGKTWKTDEIPFEDAVKSVLTGFSTEKNGWILTCSGPSMGSENHSLFTTSDGGDTWKKVDSDLDEVYGRVVTGANFIDKDTGFVCFRYENKEFAPAVCVTRDGGRTWQKLSMDTGDAEHPLTPLSPYYNDKLILLPVYSNYDSVNYTAMVSADKGESWSRVSPEPELYDGDRLIEPENGVYTLPQQVTLRVKQSCPEVNRVIVTDITPGDATGETAPTDMTFHGDTGTMDVKLDLSGVDGSATLAVAVMSDNLTVSYKTLSLTVK